MVAKAGRILNIGVALLKYYAELNLNQSGQYTEQEFQTLVKCLRP